MDTYAADLAALTKHLELEECGPHRPLDRRRRGGAIRARHGGSRVVESGADRCRAAGHGQERRRNPGGLPFEVFDGFRAALVSQPGAVLRDVPLGPFYGFNRPGAKVSQGVIDNWWRQGMTGGIKPQYDCIKAFSETDFTEDLKRYRRSDAGHARRRRPDRSDRGLSAACVKLLRLGTLKVYPGLGHGMCTINADRINARPAAVHRWRRVVRRSIRSE